VSDRCGARGTIDRVRPLKRITFAKESGSMALPFVSRCEAHQGACAYEGFFWEAVIPRAHLGVPTWPCGEGSAFFPPYGCLTLPKVTHIEPPELPEEVREPEVVGSVEAEIVVGEEGLVRAAGILDSSVKNAQFESAIMKAVLLWRYEPARLDGTPVAVYWTVHANVGAVDIPDAPQ
jgi:TonB family protein